MHIGLAAAVTELISKGIEELCNIHVVDSLISSVRHSSLRLRQANSGLASVEMPVNTKKK
jgi:hypothetical protein